MKKHHYWILGGCAAALLAAAIVCKAEASSVGIIGGADGPTAIYIASKINWPSILLSVGGIALLAVIAVKAFRFIMKNKEE